MRSIRGGPGRWRLVVVPVIIVLASTLTPMARAAAQPCSSGARSILDGITGAGTCRDAPVTVIAPNHRRTRRVAARPGPVYICEDTLTDLNEEFLAESFSVLGLVPPPAPSDEAELRRIRCTVDGVLVSDQFRWFEPGVGVNLDDAGRRLTRDFADELLLPLLSISTDPTTTGLVGLDTWFWIDGWDGEPLTRSVVDAGFPFDLRLELTAVTWDFGDGSTASDDSLGLAYPAAGGTVHRYDIRSTSEEEPTGAYEVTATLTVAASYSLGGGPFVPVDPVIDQSTVSFVVREAQAVIR